MGLLVISYEQAVQRYPAQVAAIMARLQKSRSREKGALPSDLLWKLKWATKIVGMSFAQVLSRQEAQPVMSLEECVADEVNRSNAWLQGEIGRFYDNSDIKDFPEEITAFIRIKHEERLIEEARILALTPEQREEELLRTLASLHGKPGFVTLHIKEGK